MSYEYKKISVNISDFQKDKIRKAIENNKSVTIQLSYEDLVGNDVIAVTQDQLDDIAEAYQKKEGIRIKMSKTQTKHNKEMTGGFLGALLSAALPAVIGAVAPDAISWLWNKITGKSAVAKQGGQLIKIEKLGEGLYLRPYQSDKFNDIKVGNGLFLKNTGAGYDLSDINLDDVKLMNLLKPVE